MKARLAQPETVRVATQADEEAIFFLLTEDLRADNDMGYPVSLRKVAEQVKACCRGGRGIAGVIDGPDGLVASIGIQCSTPWYSDKWLLSETWAFVIPEARKGTKHGADLFRFAKWHRQDMAEKVGYEIDLERSVMSFKRLDAKVRFWRKYGPQIGAIFLTDGAHE